MSSAVTRVIGAVTEDTAPTSVRQRVTGSGASSVASIGAARRAGAGRTRIAGWGSRLGRRLPAPVAEPTAFTGDDTAILLRRPSSVIVGLTAVWRGWHVCGGSKYVE